MIALLPDVTPRLFDVAQHLFFGQSFSLSCWGQQVDLPAGAVERSASRQRLGEGEAPLRPVRLLLEGCLQVLDGIEEHIQFKLPEQLRAAAAE